MPDRLRMPCVCVHVLTVQLAFLRPARGVSNGQTLNLKVRKNRLGKAYYYYGKEIGTLWTIEGRALEGPLAGKSLARSDSQMSQWYGWVSYFPDTSIFGARPRSISVDGSGVREYRGEGAAERKAAAGQSCGCRCPANRSVTCCGGSQRQPRARAAA